MATELESGDSERCPSENSELKELIPTNDTEKGENHSSFSSDNVTSVAKLEPERKHIPSVLSALVIGSDLYVCSPFRRQWCSNYACNFSILDCINSTMKIIETS